MNNKPSIPMSDLLFNLVCFSKDIFVVYVLLQLLSSIDHSPSSQWPAGAVHNDQALPYFTDQN